MPLQYTWVCEATIPAGKGAYSEIDATCIEDPKKGAETVIQRNYRIQINTVMVPEAPAIDFVVRIKKEDASGIITPKADSLPAKLLNKLLSVSGQIPQAFYRRGRPAVIQVLPMEKVYIQIVNLEPGGTANTTVKFQILAEKGV
jgi:hypothetical protein